eukprot:CFRG7873T1
MLFLALVIFLIGLCFVWAQQRTSVKSRRTPKGTVSELWQFPIKSCKGTMVNEVQLDALGIVHDRNLMVVTSEGMFITQRQKPRMSLISCARTETHITLSVDSKVVADLTVKLPSDDSKAQTLKVEIWDNEVEALVVEGTQAWFTSVLGSDARLVSVKPFATHSRPVDPRYNPTGDNTHVAFQDGFPQLVITDSSITDLNKILIQNGVDIQAIDSRRFRPNIVVKGFNAHEEDLWKKIRIGDTVFDAVKPCTRCAIPTIDPDTGKYNAGFQPIKTLRDYRSVGDKVIFGMNLIHRGEGNIHVGDTVEVLEWK